MIKSFIHFVKTFFASVGVVALVATYCFGLEFGTMGNVSAGMGGAGVAVKNSPFALYYNPALLSAETKRVRFGYSLGIEVREKNLDKIVDINLGGLADSRAETSTTSTNFKTIQGNLEKLKSALSQNAFNLISQNGITFQFAPALLRGSIGTFGVGYFASFYGGSSIKADPSKMELILKYSGAQGDAYCKVDSSGGCTASLSSSPKLRRWLKLSMKSLKKPAMPAKRAKPRRKPLNPRVE